MRVLTTALLSLATATGLARAACPGDAEIARFVEDWSAKRPGKALAVDNVADARCAQEKVLTALQSSLGKPVGYKAGLTSKAAQERFKADGPVSGILLEDMLLESGASLPVAYGARPLWEADMLLVVEDEGINDAKTPEEAVRYISAMRPFIELPDLALAEGEPLDAVQLSAINVGARLGVAGAEVPLDGSPETLKALTETKIVATDASGAVLAEATGAATLGSPLHAVVWLVSDLAKTGRKLVAGDLVSVGSFTPLTAPKAGQEITVRYEGLPGTPEVSVRFE